MLTVDALFQFLCAQLGAERPDGESDRELWYGGFESDLVDEDGGVVAIARFDQDGDGLEVTHYSVFVPAEVDVTPEQFSRMSAFYAEHIGEG